MADRCRRRYLALWANVRLIRAFAIICCALLGMYRVWAEVPQANAHEIPSTHSDMAARLTHRPGDPRRGRIIAANSDRGNCIVCHKMPIPEIPPAAFGDLGPPLEGVGTRLSAAELRLRIVDARRINPNTIMPPYHALDGLHRVARRYIGRPILSAQDVEDVIAYLATLR